MLARVGSLFIKMLVTALLLPNYLGAGLNGTLNYPLTFLSLFIGLCTLGTDTIVTRQLLKKPELKNELLGSAFRIRLWGGMIAIPVVLGVYYLLAQYTDNPPAASFHHIGIVSLICIIQSIQIIDSYFQSQTQGKMIMLAQVGANIFSALLKLGLVLAKASVDMFIIMLVVDVLLLNIGYVYLYRKEGNSIFAWKYDKAIARSILNLGWPLAFSAIFISIYMRIGQLMVDAYLGKEALGVYSTTIQYTESTYFIPVALCTALFPAIINYQHNQPEVYQKRMSNLYDLMMVIAVTIALGITLIAPTLYQLFYAKHPEFMEGARVLQINAWGCIFVFLGTASSQYLLAEGYTKISLYRTILGAITNISLNTYLIPRIGLTGAAISTVCSYFVSAFAILLFPKTRAHGLVLLKSLLFISLVQSLRKRF